MTKNKVFTFFVCCVVFFLFFSCAGDGKSFHAKMNLNESSGNVQIIKEEQNGKNLVLYNLKKQPKINQTDPVFFKAEIDKASGPYVFTINTTAWIKEIEFMAENKKTVIYFTISEPCKIKSFSISLPENIDKEIAKNIVLPSLEEVRSISKNDFIEGYQVSNNSISQSENFRNTIIGSKNSFIFDLNGYFISNPLSHLTIEIDEKKADEINEIYISFYNSGGINIIKAFTIKGRINITSTDLSEIISEFPFEKTKTDTIVTINSAKNNNIIKKILITRGQIVDTSPFTALEADFGTIINYPIEKWRHEQYELFAWSIFPEFIVIDTVNYKFQDSMFKRLAFFVEKPESAGKLLTDIEMSGQHGWNAHDYKAEDMCNFFNLAEETGFILSDEEELLKVILQENKIIKKDKSQFLPLRGGILSVSRETTPKLRKVFVNHEGYHGVFFSSKEFREKSSEIWDNTSPDVKLFWKVFLAHRNYDIENNYLLVNEFMAYNLQQSPGQCEDYIFNYSIPLLEKRYVSRKEFFDNLKENYREEFYSVSSQFADSLFSITGLPPGNLFFINKK